MASRFLFRKFSDGMSRSTSRLGTHGTLGNIFHGSAVHLPGMTVPSNRGIHGYATKYLKQTFSSSASKQAEMAAKQAHDGARKPEIPLRGIPQRDVDTTLALFTVGGVGFFYIVSHDDVGGTNKGSRCNCQCHSSNVKQD